MSHLGYQIAAIILALGVGGGLLLLGLSQVIHAYNAHLEIRDDLMREESRTVH